MSMSMNHIHTEAETEPKVHTTPLCRGRVYYERGIEVLEVEGWIMWEGPWVAVFGNPDLPVLDQPHTAIPLSRVVETECFGESGVVEAVRVGVKRFGQSSAPSGSVLKKCRAVAVGGSAGVLTALASNAFWLVS